MEGKNQGESEKYRCKLENKCNNIFIRWQKIFAIKNNKKIPYRPKQ